MGPFILLASLHACRAVPFRAGGAEWRGKVREETLNGKKEKQIESVLSSRQVTPDTGNTREIRWIGIQLACLQARRAVPFRRVEWEDV